MDLNMIVNDSNKFNYPPFLGEQPISYVDVSRTLDSLERDHLVLKIQQISLYILSALAAILPIGAMLAELNVIRFIKINLRTTLAATLGAPVISFFTDKGLKKVEESLASNKHKINVLKTLYPKRTQTLLEKRRGTFFSRNPPLIVNRQVVEDHLNACQYKGATDRFDKIGELLAGPEVLKRPRPSEESYLMKLNSYQEQKKLQSEALKSSVSFFAPYLAKALSTELPDGEVCVKKITIDYQPEELTDGIHLFTPSETPNATPKQPLLVYKKGASAVHLNLKDYRNIIISAKDQRKTFDGFIADLKRFLTQHAEA
jgi:hypothetical protein